MFSGMSSKLKGRLLISPNSPINMPSSVKTLRGICNCASSTRLISGSEGLREKYAPSTTNIANKQQLILVQNKNLISFNIDVSLILSLKNTTFSFNKAILFS